MVCKKCGRVMAAGQIVCKACGYHQEMEKVTVPPEIKPGPPRRRTRQGRTPGRGKRAPGPSRKKFSARQRRKALLLLAGMGIVVCSARYGWLYLREQQAIDEEISEMQEELTQGAALSRAVERLFVREDSDYLKEQVTGREIERLVEELKEISKEPAGMYRQEVRDALNLNRHEKRLRETEDRLREAMEKEKALLEITPIFETAVITGEVCAENRPLSETAGLEEIRALCEKYKDCDRRDAFWYDVYDLLTDAEIEIQWIADAQEAVADLENRADFHQYDFAAAQEEVDFLYDGEQKTALRERLDALRPRMTVIETRETAFTLEDYMKEHPQRLALLRSNEELEGIAEISAQVTENILTIQVSFDDRFQEKSLMDSMEGEMEHFQQLYQKEAEMLRWEIPEAKVVLEFYQGNGSLLYRRSY